MKSNAAPQTITAGQVPPCCYLLPGMSAEEGGGEAIKALNISHHCAAWRVTAKRKGAHPRCAARPQKNQPRPTVQAVGLFNRGDAPEKE